MGDNQSDNSWEEEVQRERDLEQQARAQLLRFFKYDHLPPRLAEVSRPFFLLAEDMIDTLGGVKKIMREEQCRIGFQKLIEAKDCFVRAALEK